MTGAGAGAVGAAGAGAGAVGAGAGAAGAADWSSCLSFPPQFCLLPEFFEV